MVQLLSGAGPRLSVVPQTKFGCGRLASLGYYVASTSYFGATRELPRDYHLCHCAKSTDAGERCFACMFVL